MPVEPYCRPCLLFSRRIARLKIIDLARAGSARSAAHDSLDVVRGFQSRSIPSKRFGISAQSKHGTAIQKIHTKNGTTPLGRKVTIGFNSQLSLPARGVKRCRIIASKMAISMSAKLLPMHILGPPPKGK